MASQNFVTRPGSQFVQSGTGAVERTVESKLQDVVSVLDFIPQSEHAAIKAGTSTYDATAAIQAAANSSTHGTLFFPRGTYLVNAQITVSNKDIKGESATNTTIKPSTSVSSVFQVAGQNCVIENLDIDGNNLANACVLMAGTNSSCIRNCIIEKAKLDGIQYNTTGNNSNSVVESCLVRIHGTEYSTGTAAGTVGSSIVTITGADDLTTLGIRLNETYIYMASDSGGFAYEVTAVSPTTVLVYPPLSSTFSGSTYRILQGSCINIRRNGDNSRITVRNCNIQAGKVAGIQDRSLYSVVSIANFYQANSYGRICGARQAAQPTYGPMEFANYYESNTYYDLLYAYALGENVRISASGQDPTQKVFSGSTGPTILSKTAESVLPALGIAFPAVQTEASNANTLDDYEEGTFTPTIIGSTDAGTGTYSVQQGNYTKIGDTVFVQGYVVWTAHTGTGSLRIGSLPFTSNAASQYRAPVTLGYVRDLAITAGTQLTAQLGQNATYISFWAVPHGGGNPISVALDTAGYVSFSVTYKV